MATTQEILDREFESIKQDLIAQHDKIGMRASGKWVQSLETDITVSVSGANAKILGEKYTTQLVQGRKPGKFPPIKAIKQWVEDKGIAARIRGEISVSSLAFLIARKIAQEGTKYFQQGGTDLVSAVITPQRIQKIINLVGAEATISFVKVIQNQLKDVA